MRFKKYIGTPAKYLIWLVITLDETTTGESFQQYHLQRSNNTRKTATTTIRYDFILQLYGKYFQSDFIQMFYW